MRRKSDKSKQKEGYGTGHGADYKPYIRTAEFNSSGTCANPVDWKTGRTVQLLSQGEKYFWYLMRWNDHVTDIREQFPLPVEDTMQIAEQYGIQHPRKGSELAIMTSDFLVDFDDNTQGVFSIKASKAENIRAAVQYYVLSDVHDSVSMAKYMVANKMLIMDKEMQTKQINFKELAEEFKELIEFKDRKKIGE